MAWLHAVIDVPAPQLTATARFWEQLFGWPLGRAWDGHAELSSFEPPQGTPYLHLQRIDGPPRVHIDVECDDPAAAAARAGDLGARVIAAHDKWQTFESPGDLPFCLLQAQPHEPPGPTVWPDGHRSRMVQVCIDSPESLHDTEVAFWRSLLEGRWVDSDSPEFAGKWHDDAGSPLQLLFQRLDATEGQVRAHLDHGTDDVDAEVRRALDLGASDVGRGRGWQVLRDVTGQAFCVTRNSPSYERHRDLG